MKLQRTESHVLIEVKDSGIGIPPEDHARIFRCFERAAPKSLGSSGTGLGLYLTSQFVQAMGGNVSVRSKPGEGSIFSVTLPITQAVALGSSKVSSITGNYVMAVDDSLEALRIVEFYLRDLPLTVITCQHSELALSQFMNHDIGLVILDIDLPRLDGISLAKAIRDFERSHGRKACVMISLSAAMDQATIARCQSAGINDCLPKPITQAQLAAVVSRYMGQEDTASGTLMSDQFPAPLARLLICRAHELREQLRKAYHARDLSTFLRLAHQCINTFGYFTDATEVVGACKSLCGTEHFGTEVDEVMDCVEAWCDRHSKSDA